MRGKIWWILAAVLAALAAACLWLVPGVRFSGVLCAALAVACLLWLDINYYLREPFALVKTWILDIAMKGVTI